MAQVINTNTMSLNAQRNLSTSGASLATTIQRLSSGLRINSAKDDAAGLAFPNASARRSAAWTSPCAMPTTAFRWHRSPKVR